MNEAALRQRLLDREERLRNVLFRQRRELSTTRELAELRAFLDRQAVRRYVRDAGVRDAIGLRRGDFGGLSRDAVDQIAAHARYAGVDRCAHGRERAVRIMK